MNTTNVGDIDPSKEEGKLLMAALAIITTECRTDKTPWEVIEELKKLCEIMYIK